MIATLVALLAPPVSADVPSCELLVEEVAGHVPRAVELYANGDAVLVAESFHLGPNGVDVLVRRTSPSGELRWELVFDGAEHGHDHVDDVGIDGAGRLRVLGHRVEAGAGRLFVLAISAAGELEWEASVEGWPGPLFDAALAVDPSGSTTLTGVRGADALVARFDADGALLWERTLHLGDLAVPTRATDVARAASGLTYVAGDFRTEAGLPWFFLAAYDPGGALLWTHTDGGQPFPNAVFPPAVVDVDASGNGFLAGTVESACGVGELRATKLSPDGVPLWSWAHPAPDCEHQSLTAVATAPDGDLVVAGSGTDHFGSGAGTSLLTIRLSGRDGSTVWEAAPPPPPGGTRRTTALAVGPSGRVVVTGRTAHGLPSLDVELETIEYGPLGLPLWSAVRPEDASSAAVAVGPAGETAVAARYWSGEERALLVRYQAAVGPFADHDADGVPDACQALTVDVDELSIAAGGAAHLVLDAGATLAGGPWLMLGSVSGTSPGLPLGPWLLPLVVDAYTELTLAAPADAPLSPGSGSFDPSGSAGASFALGAGQLPAGFAGLEVWHAFVALDAAGEIGLVSNPVRIDLVP